MANYHKISTLRMWEQMGASMVKWTALDPCSGLSVSDPKLYTNTEFYEIEFHYI